MSDPRLFEVAQPDNYHGNPPSQPTPTSIDAADLIAPKAGTLRAAVLQAITAAGDEGATDHELITSMQMDPSTLRPRRRELELGGHIEHNGVTRPTPSGRQAKVWTATQQKEQT
jgi:hypothetical protein